MSYLLVVITVLYTGGGVTSDTTFQEFLTESACKKAQVGIEQGVLTMKGTVGREVFAECYPKE